MADKVTEDTKDQKRRQKLFSEAGLNASKWAIDCNLPMVYISNGWLVRRLPDGRIEKIEEAIPPIRLKKKQLKLP